MVRLCLPTKNVFKMMISQTCLFYRTHVPLLLLLLLLSTTALQQHSFERKKKSRKLRFHVYVLAKSIQTSLPIECQSLEHPMEIWVLWLSSVGREEV